MTHPDQWLFKCNEIKARPRHKYLVFLKKFLGKCDDIYKYLGLFSFNSRVSILILYCLFTSVVSSVNNISHKGMSVRHY